MTIQRLWSLGLAQIMISKKLKNIRIPTGPISLEEAAVYIRERGIKHLLIDQPSVDREHDEGKLLAHKAFWNYSVQERLDATITELIYAPDSIPDGDAIY